MDFDTIKEDDTLVLEFINPLTGELSDTTITIYGSGSMHYRSAQAKVKSEGVHDRWLELLALNIKSWKNVSFNKTKNYKLTVDNAVELLRSAGSLRLDIENKMFDRVNFMKGKG